MPLPRVPKGLSQIPVPTAPFSRPAARGKFLYLDGEKFYVRGATYGAFRPDERKREYQNFDRIDRDFRQMANAGFNAVRIPHTMPPRKLLDIAFTHGLHVMVGLSAEQYVGYLADPSKGFDIDGAIRARVQDCAGHPALLCYALGNEIPASMVRWLGRGTVERYLEQLFHVVKDVDSDALVTYVNYPSTEYLDLPFLDFVSFNVYLESEERLRAYLARLQNLAGDRPVLMSEMGLDSFRNGEDAQANSLAWQIQATFESGCTGAFVFSWTDEWYRGGAEVDDWSFGLTDRERRPKPALAAVAGAFQAVPMASDPSTPRISVVVCVHNGEATVRDCCEGLELLDYPNYEVIFVDDGSTDRTAEIISEYGFQLIKTPNRGLSQARNTGLAAATGEIIAYTDGDARPDRDWLTYLAAEFRTSSHVGIGGWNIAPSGDGWMAECVANSPGGPVHVLLADSTAEHIPGCCMAFRKDALDAIGGFDPQFHAAGDDVDVCWRLQARGGTLGFSHGAMVWHHNRNSLSAYWKQQLGYGKAEALLERKWPEKYNSAGHVTWGGRLYGRGLTMMLGTAGRIYQGVWGSAPFQRLDAPQPSLLQMMPLMPEWQLLAGLCVLLSVLGLLWPPLLLTVPLSVGAVLLTLAQAVVSAKSARFSGDCRGFRRFRLCTVVALLHVLQPLARLRGRILHGLTCWRWRGATGFSLPIRRTFPIWIGRWLAPDERLHAVCDSMRSTGAVVLHGGDYDAWDLEVRGGLLGRSRLQMATEDSGSGTQLVRLRSWPIVPKRAWFLLALFSGVAATAAVQGAVIPAVVLALIAALMCVRVFSECAMASRVIYEGLASCGLLTSTAPVVEFAPEREGL